MLLQQASQLVSVELKGSAIKRTNILNRQTSCELVFMSALVLLHACFHCEKQRGRKEYNLSDVKCSVSWNLLGSGPDPDEV